MKKIIAIDMRKCTACGDCRDHCPQKILELQDISKKEKENMSFFRRMDAFYHKNKKLVIAHPEKCLGCGLCLNACRHFALSVETKEDGSDSNPLPMTPRPSIHIENDFKKRITNFPPFYFFGFIILDLLFYFLLPQLNKIPLPYNLFGIVILVPGLYILKKSSNIFNRNKTTFLLEKPSVFVQNGFFRITRNPMYLGSLILIFGLAISLGNLAGLISPLLFFFSINWLCIPHEETLMERTFGSRYLAYKQRVRRWL